MSNVAELKVFVAAAEELNFSRAAHRLHLSQSAVSQNIQLLEKTYGVELFVRHGRTVELSETGQLILPMARGVLNSMRMLEDTLANTHGEIGGELTIGCSATTGKYFIPSLLAAFRQDHPSVRTRVSVMSRHSISERLIDLSLALGVVSKRINHRDVESHLLMDDRLILIVPADHPWAAQGSISPRDILGQPFIRREESSGTCDAVFNALRACGVSIEMLNIIMELGNAEAVEMAVERGIGIAFVSELVAARGLALGRVKKVQVEGVSPVQQIFLCRQAANTFTRAESAFWDFVQARGGQLRSELLYNLADVTPA